MKKTAAIAFIVSLLLYSCHQNKPVSQIPVVGEAVDSVAIAQDTFQQKGFEESYEYAQTVVVSPKLVYDIRAYGGPPSHGEYCIIRRAGDNKQDTVVQGERFGVIVNAFTGDLNNNGKEEIYIVMRSASPQSPTHLAAFEFDKNGKSSTINCGPIDDTLAIPCFINSAKDFKEWGAIRDSVFAVRDSVFSEERRLERIYYYTDKNKKHFYWRFYLFKYNGLMIERSRCN